MSCSQPSSPAETESRRRTTGWLTLALLLTASGSALAEVFQTDLGGAAPAPGLGAALQAEVELGPRRSTFWNGVKVELQQGVSRRSPAELFDRVMQRASSAVVADATQADPPDFDAELQGAIERGHRRDGDGWSALVRLPDRVRDMASVVEGRVPEAPAQGPDRDGFIAVAIEDAASGRTDVLVTHLDRRSPLLEIFGVEGTEVSGSDVEGLPRYPGSQRTLAFSEPLGASAVHQVAYEGGGSVADHVRHYRQALREAGLRETPGVSPADGTEHLRFAGPDREVSVYVQPHPDGRRTLDLIQLRFRRDPS